MIDLPPLLHLQKAYVCPRVQTNTKTLNGHNSLDQQYFHSIYVLIDLLSITREPIVYSTIAFSLNTDCSSIYYYLIFHKVLLPCYHVTYCSHLYISLLLKVEPKLYFLSKCIVICFLTRVAICQTTKGLNNYLISLVYISKLSLWVQEDRVHILT